jgi:hypothetical protein
MAFAPRAGMTFALHRGDALSAGAPGAKEPCNRAELLQMALAAVEP